MSSLSWTPIQILTWSILSPDPTNLAQEPTCTQACHGQLANSAAEAYQERKLKLTISFTIPGLCNVKIRTRSAGKASMQEVFGIKVNEKTQPAREIVKASSLADRLQWKAVMRQSCVYNEDCIPNAAQRSRFAQAIWSGTCVYFCILFSHRRWLITRSVVILITLGAKALVQLHRHL